MADALRLFLALAACSLAGCRACDEGSTSVRANDASVPGVSATSDLRTIAGVFGFIDALATFRGTLFGLVRERGVVFSVATTGDAGKGVFELSTVEKEPFALVVRAGSPVWASREGVFVCDPDGHDRRPLVTSDTVRALTSSPHGLVYSDAGGLWRMEWPQAKKAVRLAEDVFADEVVATDEAVVWLDRGSGSAWTLDLKSGARRAIGSTERKPHDLSLSNDGKTVLWHEGEADLLPGREPRAFLADTVSFAVREVPGEFASASRYLLRGACLYGPAVCKPMAFVDWTRLDSGEGQAPVADDADRFYWVAQDSSGAERASARSRIVSASKAVCCR